MTKPVLTGRSSAAGRRNRLRDLGRLLLGHSSRFRDRRLQELAARAVREADGRPPWTVAILNGSLRVRRRLHTTLAVGRRRRSLRVFRAAGGEHARTRRTMSLLCPTRERAGQLVRFLRSVARTAADPGRIEVLCYVDEDDPQVGAYRELFAGIGMRFPRLGRCELLVGPPVGVPAAWNELASAARGGLLMMANDDQLYMDHGWDAALDARVDELDAEYPDDVLCLYFDAGQYPEGGHDFPILTRSWYRTLGYFAPTMFSQWEVETWVFDIAERLGRLAAVPGVLVEHLHFQDYKAPFDATYQRHRATSEKAFADHALFIRLAETRAADAAKLQRVIDEHARAAGAPNPGEGTPDPGESSGTGEAVPPWFAALLAEHCHGASREIEAWLAEGADRSGAVPLLADGDWSARAWRSFPEITAALDAVPEATATRAAAVDLIVVPAGGTSALKHDGTRVWWPLRVPLRSALTIGGRPAAIQFGECILSAGGRVDAVNHGDGPLVLVSFDLGARTSGSAHA